MDFPCCASSMKTERFVRCTDVIWSKSFDIFRWKINIDGVEGTLYDGEHFQLLFKFNNKYPFDSPEVTFIGPNIPVHPHVYSNGHICLSILTEDWWVFLNAEKEKNIAELGLLWNVFFLGRQRYLYNQFVWAYRQCWAVAEKRNDLRITHFMYEHAIKIRKRLNGGITVSKDYQNYRIANMISMCSSILDDTV